MTVRAARADELAVLAAAVAEQPLLRRYGATAGGLLRDLQGALARGDILLVGDDGPRVAGFAWCQVRTGLGLGGYLKLIAVTPGGESRGLGAALLTEAETRVAREQRHLLLLVSDVNTGAQRFYERHGYTRVGVLPAAVLADVDEILYWKRLR